MTDYATSRDDAFFARIQTAIEDFASQYGLNAYSSGQRRTIFLFPGGLGSDLMRSYQAYPDPAQSFEKVWFDAGVLFGDVPRLAMLSGDVDTEQKYVVPDGCVNIPGPELLHAYEIFIHWCRRNSIDLFVFGWDWRRSVEDAADFFLNVFLPKFDARFSGTPHPLDHFTFLGHSAGGMVIKAMLNCTSNQYVQRVKKAITVSTPFYGYGDQIVRFLKGDPYLLWFGIPRSVSATIISSLPGGYEYSYLDYPTYLANEAAFSQDPEGYNLDAYPSMDADDPTEVADPYDPQPGSDGRVRYPLQYGFKSTLLYRGNVTARNISKPLADATIAAKLYNIRGVQTNNGQPVNNTPVGQYWARVPPLFSADFDPDPIQDRMGPGDGTQSAWTARLLGLPASQIITIKGDDLDHVSMLDRVDVRARIAELIGLDVNSLDFDNDALGFTELAASLQAFNEFMEELGKLSGIARDFMPEQFSLRRYEQFNTRKATHLRNFKPAQLQRLLARLYVEAVNHPGKARVLDEKSELAIVREGNKKR